MTAPEAEARAPKRAGGPRARTPGIVWARRATQTGFLLLFLFLFLQTEQRGADSLGYPVKLFLDFDPLLLFSSLLSAHAVPAALWLSLLLIPVTLVLGRVFCGWACPLGTLNHLAGSLRRWPAKPRTRGWFRVKYLLLIGLLAAALFSAQLTGLFDPLSLLVRSLALGAYPALNVALNGLLDLAYGLKVNWAPALGDALLKAFSATLLAFRQPHFRQGFLITAILLAILGLNFIERRFWCRYLCPLGALLGLFARFGLLKRRVSEECTSCALCDHACQGSAGPGSTQGWKASECFMCMSCEASCPSGSGGFGFGLSPSPEPADVGRRRAVLAAFSGAAAVAVLRAAPGPGAGRPAPLLIRPPGALREPDFLERCVRCGECMKVCTTGGLQPTLLEAGLEGIWTPVLVPRIGYCEYNCTLCGQVCPTGAIQKLPAEQKRKVRIGLATIDKSRCLPYAHATPCIVCQEVCPTPVKAIWFERAAALARSGAAVEVKQPRVDLDLCIGCGICEAKCPVLDQPAITVSSLGESRDPDHQLLLSQ